MSASTRWEFTVGKVSLLYVAGLILGVNLTAIVLHPEGGSLISPVLGAIAMLGVTISTFLGARRKALSGGEADSNAVPEEREKEKIQ